jgi:rhodanese-related sulfurtransferase
MAALAAAFIAASWGLVAPLHGTILVDVRGPGAYVQRHLRGASSIPLAQLEARLFELPAPTEDAIALVGADAVELRAAADLLGERGWAVAGLVDASDPLAWAACLAAGWAEAPEGSACSAPSWRANLFLRAALGGFAREAARAEAAAAGTGEVTAHGNAPTTPRRVALDLGAGNGRDAVFLADALGADWDVVAVDNNGGALARCEALAARAGVGARVRTDARNLRRGGAESAAGWTDGSVRLAHGSRFLVKALVPLLRDTVLVEAGALFI